MNVSEQLNYEVKMSWLFNLTNQTNIFKVSSLSVCDPGYLFLYTIIGDGRIAFDSIESSISDYKMDSNKKITKIDSTSNKRFNIFVLLDNSIVKQFTLATSLKTFYYPGFYQIKIWLQGVGQVVGSSLWKDGFDYDINVKLLTVTDGI